MADNQKEKILRLIKGRYKSMEEASNKLGISRATLYNKISEVPLDEEFKEMMKLVLDIDLDTMSISVNNEIFNKDELLKENIRLHKLLEKYLIDGNASKDKIIELQQKIEELKDKYERRQG